jgi:hypothetical protein
MPVRQAAPAAGHRHLDAGVGSRALDDPVAALGGVADDDVGQAAGQRQVLQVRAQGAGDGGEDQSGPDAVVQDVVAVGAEQRVRAADAEEQVVALPAADRVVPLPPSARSSPAALSESPPALFAYGAVPTGRPCASRP